MSQIVWLACMRPEPDRDLIAALDRSKPDVIGISSIRQRAQFAREYN